MASTSQPISSTSINLNIPATFVRKNLTPDQADERLRILEASQEALEEKNEDLTPRSLRELKELVTVLHPEAAEIRFSVKITRKDPSKFYFIKFNEDPRVNLIEKFQLKNQQIIALEEHMPQPGASNILQTIVEPPKNMQWYQKATLAQMQSILGTDFLDALKHHYIANLNLLCAVRYLQQEPTIYKNLLNLYSSSYDTYESQIHFNRDCESAVLAHSKNTQRSLIELRNLILGCGPQLDELPKDFATQSSSIVAKEAQQSKSLYDKIGEFAKSFLKDLKVLESGINACIKQITKSNEKVLKLMKSFDNVLEEKSKLADKELKLRQKYQDFHAVKNQEYHAQKVELLGGSNIKLFGIPIYSSDPELKLVEADFGSKQLFEEYKKIENDAMKIKKELTSLESKLEKALNTHVASYSSKDALAAASRSLSVAVSAIKQLENVIIIQKSKAEVQSQFIQEQLNNQKKGIKNMNEALFILEMYTLNTLNAHAIWIQSNKQSATIQLIRKEETRMNLLIQNDIQNGTTTGITNIKSQIESLSKENAIAEKMLSNKDLLNDQKLLNN